MQQPNEPSHEVWLREARPFVDQSARDTFAFLSFRPDIRSCKKIVVPIVSHSHVTLEYFTTLYKMVEARSHPMTSLDQPCTTSINRCCRLMNPIKCQHVGSNCWLSYIAMGRRSFDVIGVYSHDRIAQASFRFATYAHIHSARYIRRVACLHPGSDPIMI